MGKWRYSFSILDLSTSWRSVATFTPPAALHYPQDSTGLTFVTERVATAGDHDCISKQVFAHATQKVLWNVRLLCNCFRLLLKWRSFLLALLICLAANEHYRLLTFWGKKFIHIRSTITKKCCCNTPHSGQNSNQAPFGYTVCPQSLLGVLKNCGAQTN
jgi:hypothetical protein